MCPEFPGDPRVVGIASDGGSGAYAYDLTTGVTPSSLSLSGVAPVENPSLFSNSIGARMFICDGFHGGAPKKISLSAGNLTVGSMGGSPPNAIYSAVWAPYFVLANGSVTGTNYPNRVWFSPKTDAEGTWQVSGTTASYLDLDEAIMGMTAFQGALLVWTRHKMYRFLGSVAPGDANFDMQIQAVSFTGCIDARSIVRGTDGVFFANENGVYLTDGSSVKNLTVGSGHGISSLWRSLMSNFSVILGNVVACGLYQDMYLFVTITKSGGSFTSTFLYYIPTGAWVTLSDACAGDMFATALATPSNSQNDIYISRPKTQGSSCQMVKAAGIFSPTSSNEQDAGGVDLQPQWISRVYPGGIDLRRFGYGHIAYKMPATGSPTLVVSQATGQEPSGFSTVPEGSPFAVSSSPTRRRFRSFKDSNGLSIQVTQSGSSTQTIIYGCELEVGSFMEAEGS